MTDDPDLLGRLATALQLQSDPPISLARFGEAVITFESITPPVMLRSRVVQALEAAAGPDWQAVVARSSDQRNARPTARVTSARKPAARCGARGRWARTRNIRPDEAAVDLGRRGTGGVLCAATTTLNQDARPLLDPRRDLPPPARAPKGRAWLKHWCREVELGGLEPPDLLGAIQAWRRIARCRCVSCGSTMPDRGSAVGGRGVVVFHSCLTPA
jgi:hypothetical protein